MRESTSLRLITLVSYGTQFLRGRLTLEDWYRHGIFFDARLHFRSREDHALLADDFTLWLGVLKAEGATRLSLHLANRVADAARLAELHGDYAVVVHFEDRHQLWICGEEKASWSEHRVMDWEVPGFQSFPDASSYSAEIDTFLMTAELQGKAEVPETDWHQLSVSIAADLDISIVTHGHAKPLLPDATDLPEWAKLPVMPYSALMTRPHQLIRVLIQQRHKFNNDTHCKNDSGHYAGLDGPGKDKVDAWGARLDGWLTEVTLRCANEAGILDPEKRSGGQTTYAPAVPTGSPPPLSETAQPPGEPATSAAGQASGSLGKVTVFAVIVTVTCLLVLGLARVISAHPWLALMAALFLVTVAYLRDARGP